MSEKDEMQESNVKQIALIGAMKRIVVCPLLLLLFLIGLLLGGCSDVKSNGCVDVTLGNAQLSVPQQYLTPNTPRKDNSGNFIFAFDSSISGIDCPVGCKELFVNISSTSPTPEKSWIFMQPKFTGQMSGNYQVYHDRFTDVSKPTREILVPLDTASSSEEFYVCTPDGLTVNPTCNIRIFTQSGLVAEFSIPRKVLSRVREAASFVTQAINQFSENHKKGICK